MKNSKEEGQGEWERKERVMGSGRGGEEQRRIEVEERNWWIVQVNLIQYGCAESNQIDQETSKPNSISANNISDSKHTVFNIGLSHDLLKKLDQQNMNQINGSDFKNQISSANWYAPNLASNTSNVNLKTAKPK